MADSPNWPGYENRAVAAAPFLQGRGIELGAGAAPQRLPDGAEAVYFDKRGEGELCEYLGSTVRYPLHRLEEVGRFFPVGADFLIAHNVLEHIHDHIGALLEWHSYVRDGGVVVVSVPERVGQDKDRPAAPFSHILLDHVLERDENWLETREHVMSFCLGWQESWPDKGREEFAAHVLFEGNRQGHDCHWHAVDRGDWDKVIAGAAVLGGVGLQILHTADMRTDGPTRTDGEIIYIYRVDRANTSIKGLPNVLPEIDAVADLLAAAQARLERHVQVG